MNAPHDEATRDEIVAQAAVLLHVSLGPLLEGARDLCFAHGVLEAIGALDEFEVPEAARFAALVPVRLLDVLRGAARRDEPYVVSADPGYAATQRKRAAEARALRRRGLELVERAHA